MGLYVLYSDKVPMYVGIADRLGERISDHTSDWLKDSWSHFSWFGNKVLREGDEAINRAEPNVALGVRPKRVWHDFEAVVYYAFGFQVIEKGFGTDVADKPKGGRNRRVPFFGGDAHRWTQVKREL